MASLDVDSLFTNVNFDETINIIIEKKLKMRMRMKLFITSSKTSLAAKESYFLFDEELYQQVDGVVMGSRLDPTLANIFFFAIMRISG